MIACELCSSAFISRSKLFDHLRDSHGLEGREKDNNKVILLVGWIAEGIVEDQLLDEESYEPNRTISLDFVEKCVFRSIGEGDLERHPRGYSRSSRSTQMASLSLGVERASHGCADVMALPLPRVSNVSQWIDEVNSSLPSSVRILGRIDLPKKARSFNAEVSSTQRRLECFLPIDAFLDPSLQLQHIPFAESTKELDRIVFSRESEAGLARIERFLALKEAMKLLVSESRQLFHNFVVGGGACPDDAVAKQRVDRLYHSELRQAGREVWAVFSISGSNFLYGQVRKMLACVLAVARGWLPAQLIIDALSAEYTLFLPAVPAWTVYLAECRFIMFESKQDLCLDPRRGPRSDMDPVSRLIDEWRRKIQDHIAQTHSRHGDWVHNLREKCADTLVKWSLIQASRARTLIQPPPASPPREYATVLRLLRHLDSSGAWPETTYNRQKVLHSGATFTVGCLPRHLAQPTANELFAELMLECFRLERELRPERPPSSTIAVNRDSQFRPHRDTGAGSGQSPSLIVALGDFSGGELLVEDSVHDIRYRPLEFDGWTQRHSTLPFAGQRFTLVWFTPLAVTADQLYWLDHMLKVSITP